MEYTPTELEVFARQQAPQIARAETGDRRAGSGGVCSPGAAGHTVNQLNIEQTFPLLQLNQLTEQESHSTLKRGTR